MTAVSAAVGDAMWREGEVGRKQILYASKHLSGIVNQTSMAQRLFLAGGRSMRTTVAQSYQSEANNVQGQQLGQAQQLRKSNTRGRHRSHCNCPCIHTATVSPD